MRLKILLGIIIVSCFIYSWFWLVNFFAPSVSVNSIELGQYVTVKDGDYKFIFNDVNNGYELNDGVVKIKNNKINLFIAHKYYNSLWDKGIIECYKDLEKIPLKHGVSLIKQNDDIFEGFIGHKNSPFKLYAKGECKKSPDKEAIMTLTFSESEKYTIDEKNVLSIDNKLLDKSEWVVHNNEVHLNKVSDKNKPYIFLYYALGDKFNYQNTKPIINDGIKLYYANSSGMVKIGDLSKDDKIEDIENDRFFNNINGGQELVKELVYSNYIRPNKLYIQMDEQNLVKGIYAIDKVDPIYGFEGCIDKLKNYKTVLLSKHDMEWKFTEFYKRVSTEENQLGKLYFSGIDKTNNVTIDLKCQENKLYKGNYMIIKIEKM